MGVSGTFLCGLSVCVLPIPSARMSSVDSQDVDDGLHRCNLMECVYAAEHADKLVRDSLQVSELSLRSMNIVPPG